MRVRVGGGWGFAATRDLTPAGARGRAGPRAGHRRGPARRPRAAARAGRRRRAATGPRRATPTRSRSRSRTSSRCSSPRRRRCAATRGSCAATAELHRPPRAQGVRLDRGRRVHPGARSSCGARHRGRTRSTARSCRSARTPLAHGGDSSPPRAGSTCSALDLAAHAPRVAAEAVELLSAPPLPRGRADDRAARRAARAADPRVDRPRARARPDPARRGLLRRHELGRRSRTSAACATAPSS